MLKNGEEPLLGRCSLRQLLLDNLLRDVPQLHSECLVERLLVQEEFVELAVRVEFTADDVG